MFAKIKEKMSPEKIVVEKALKEKMSPEKFVVEKVSREKNFTEQNYPLVLS